MKTYFITGSNRGIGLEFTKELLETGNKVIATFRSLSSFLPELFKKHEGTCQLIELDVTKSDQINKLKKELKGTCVDILINNAGILLGGTKNINELDAHEIMQIFDVNVIGPMRVIQALLPSMALSSSPIIVNVSSRVGSIADNESGEYYGYRSSKAALNMFNKTLSIELKPQNITCITLHPGWVKTDMGGPHALIEPERSVKGMLQVIKKCSLNETGRFFSYTGEEIPW